MLFTCISKLHFTFPAAEVRTKIILLKYIRIAHAIYEDNLSNSIVLLLIKEDYFSSILLFNFVIAHSFIHLLF